MIWQLERAIKHAMPMFTSLTAAALIAVCPPPPQRRHTCVHDGDTFWWQGEKIRIIDIDTPELNSRDPDERAAAIAARDRLIQLLRERGVTIERVAKDRFGRTLAKVGDIGEQLMKEGHALPWR